MRSYAASRGAVLRKVRIPNMLPFLFTALKVGATLAFIGAVVGEYFGGTSEVLGRVVLTSDEQRVVRPRLGGDPDRAQSAPSSRICVVSHRRAGCHSLAARVASGEPWRTSNGALIVAREARDSRGGPQTNRRVRGERAGSQCYATERR